MQVSPINNNSTSFKGTIIWNEIFDKLVSFQTYSKKKDIYPSLDFLLNKTPKTDVFEFVYSKTPEPYGEVQLLRNGVVERTRTPFGPLDRKNEYAAWDILSHLGEEIANKETGFDKIGEKLIKEIAKLEEEKEPIDERCYDLWNSIFESAELGYKDEYAIERRNKIVEQRDLLSTKIENLRTQLEEKQNTYFESIKKQLGY